MALFKLFRVNRAGSVLRIPSAFVHNNFLDNVMDEIERKRSTADMPVELKNPFEKEKPKCLLCQYDIEPDYKNVRLLSQFVSRFTGRIYGRHITGLCEHKQKLVEEAIKKAQYSGLMGCYVKNPNYLTDPVLFDINKPFKVL